MLNLSERPPLHNDFLSITTTILCPFNLSDVFCLMSCVETYCLHVRFPALHCIFEEAYPALNKQTEFFKNTSQCGK